MHKNKWCFAFLASCVFLFNCFFFRSERLFINSESPWQWLAIIYEGCVRSLWSDKRHTKIACHMHHLYQRLLKRLNAFQYLHWTWCHFYISSFCLLSFRGSQIPPLRGACGIVGSNKTWARGWQVSWRSPAAMLVRIGCHNDHFKAVIDWGKMNVSFNGILWCIIDLHRALPSCLRVLHWEHHML